MSKSFEDLAREEVERVIDTIMARPDGDFEERNRDARQLATLALVDDWPHGMSLSHREASQILSDYWDDVSRNAVLNIVSRSLAEVGPRPRRFN